VCLAPSLFAEGASNKSNTRDKEVALKSFWKKLSEGDFSSARYF